MSDTLHILISHTETWACNCALYLLLYPTLPLFLKWQSCINPVEELYVPARCSYDKYYHDCTGVLPCFGVTSLVHSKFQQSMNSVASFSNCMFVKKKRWNTGYIHVLLDDSGNIHTLWVNSLWSVFLRPLLHVYSCLVGL